MSRRFVIAWALVAGCVTPPLILPTDATSDDTGDVTADSGDSSDPGTVDTQDTSFQDTADEFQDTADLNLTPIDCHPFDPMSYDGWQRRYNITFGGGGRGVETHTPDGVTALETAVAVGPITTGFVTKQQVANAGSNNQTTKQFHVCAGRGSNEAHEIGYHQTASGQTLKAGAFVTQKYLPDESEMFLAAFPPAWSYDDSYRLQVPFVSIFPFCPNKAQVRRDVEAQYVGQGFERIPVAGVGATDAYHITVLLDQTQTLPNVNPVCGLFNEAFAPLFGIFGFNSDDGSFITAQIDRWYVRGVGLVKEDATDYTTGANLYSKELTSCSGLPECP